MSKNKILKIVASVLAVLTLGGALVYFNFFDKPKKTVVFDDFTVDTYQVVDGKFQTGGETFTLSEQTKLTVINFWANWCVPCKAEMPNFAKLQRNYPDYVTVIILDSANNISWLNENPEAKGWEDFPLIFGQFDPNENDILKNYGYIGALPMTVMVDTDGNRVYHKTGGLTYEELEKETKKHLPEYAKPLYPDDTNVVVAEKNWWKENVLGVTFLAVSAAALGTAIVVSAVGSAKDKKKKKAK